MNVILKSAVALLITAILYVMGYIGVMVIDHGPRISCVELGVQTLRQDFSETKQAMMAHHNATDKKLDEILEIVSKQRR